MFFLNYSIRKYDNDTSPHNDKSYPAKQKFVTLVKTGMI
nr:MAG TPA: hypothetical protein [Caudoviricetes sp.]